MVASAVASPSLTSTRLRRTRSGETDLLTRLRRSWPRQSRMCHTGRELRLRRNLSSRSRSREMEGQMLGRLNVVSLLIGLAILYAVTAWVFHLSTTLIIVLIVIALVVFVVANLMWRRHPKK